MKKYLSVLFVLALPLMALEEHEHNWDSEPLSATEFNSYMQEALASQDWSDAVSYADVLTDHFYDTPFVQEIPYFKGYAYYQLGQYERANEVLSSYLNQTEAHSHFEAAIQMKFEIAEAFLHGKKKRLFGKGPEWLSGKEDALQIYDEVITTLPHSEIAARSFLGKAKIQAEFEDYKPSIETLSLLIRRFPKQETAAEAYLEINRVYLSQCKNTSLDLNFLDLAAMNLQKFRLAFPRESRLEEATRLVTDIEELFAQNLFETGCFFKRTSKEPASKIYFKKVIAKYPNTKAAGLARQKLETNAS